MKTVEVTAKFDEVTDAGYALSLTEQATRSNFKAAISAAIGSILKHPSLKRKRFTAVTIEARTIEAGDVADASVS